MRTSLMPMVGSGMSWMDNPRAACALTSAFMIVVFLTTIVGLTGEDWWAYTPRLPPYKSRCHLLE